MTIDARSQERPDYYLGDRVPAEVMGEALSSLFASGIEGVDTTRLVTWALARQHAANESSDVKLGTTCMNLRQDTEKLIAKARFPKLIGKVDKFIIDNMSYIISGSSNSDSYYTTMFIMVAYAIMVRRTMVTTRLPGEEVETSGPQAISVAILAEAVRFEQERNQPGKTIPLVNLGHNGAEIVGEVEETTSADGWEIE